jgi:DNA-binding response OmpR family regulator
MVDDSAGTAGLGVVVIEDDVAISGLITKVLAAEGHGVTAARNAADGFNAIRLSEPDVVVLDLGLPGSVSPASVRRR